MPRDVSIRDLPDRKWGIELEFGRGVSNRRQLVPVIENALANNNIRRSVELSDYCHDGAGNTKWKVKPDSSCGGEVASPVLSGWSGLNELNVVMDAVDRWASEENIRLVTSDCGVHVHIDCRDYNTLRMADLVGSMKVWEPLFFAMNPHSRKGNSFCIAMGTHMNGLKNARSKNEFKRLWAERANRNGTRHLGLNLGPWFLSRRGSVEFRYFAGTWAFEKAAAAILICLLTVHAVKTKETIRVPEEHLTKNFDTIWHMAGRIGFQRFADKFFKDFLVIRSGSCPAFGELIKYIKSRAFAFYLPDGSQRSVTANRRR